MSTTRREFLRAGATATAGLVVAFHLPSSVLARAEAASATLEPNAWLRIDPDGAVTVLVARSEMGQGVRTTLPMLVAEELEADWTKVRFEQAVPAPKYGDMSTGGSQSTRRSHEPLRKAGAQAREMLIEAAALTWGVDRAGCRAAKGEVVHAASGRKLGYGALVAKASTLTPPADPPLKGWEHHTLIGTSPARLDGPDKVDGRAQFGIDVHVPGMLTAVIVRCPTFGGGVRAFDPLPARAVKGVRHVAQVPTGVAVVADTYWAARKGADALKVTWDEGPHAALTSAELARTYAELAKQPGAVFRKDGEGAAALEKAAHRIEATYQAPYLAHATMEPMSCAAHVTPAGCTVWVGSQNGTNAQATAARVAGVPKERVTVRLLYLGGGFGRRSEQDFVAEAVELSKRVGAMVKVVWSREDDMRHDFYRPASLHLLRAGFDASGAPLAWTHRIVSQGVLQRLYPQAVRDGLDPTSVDVAEGQPYEVAHHEADFVIHDPGVPVGWWRSVSASQNGWAMECFVDEMAAAAKQDPLAFRRALLQKHPRQRAVLELAAEKAGWDTPLPAGRARGLALVESFETIVAHVAEVSLGADGAPRVHRVNCAVDCGHVVDPDMVRAQMESAIVFGLSAALYGEITLDKGRAVQGNFDDYPVLRIAECPAIEVHLLPQGDPVGGIGEVGLPPVAPAVTNAVSALIGRRVRRLPMTAEALKRV